MEFTIVELEFLRDDLNAMADDWMDDDFSRAFSQLLNFYKERMAESHPTDAQPHGIRLGGN